MALSVVLAGSVAQAATEISQNFGMPAHAAANVPGAVCDNRGSTVDLSGAITIGGFNVNITFRNIVKGT